MYSDLSIDAKWKALSDYMHVSSIYALVYMHQRYTIVGLCVIYKALFYGVIYSPQPLLSYIADDESA